MVLLGPCKVLSGIANPLILNASRHDQSLASARPCAGRSQFSRQPAALFDPHIADNDPATFGHELARLRLAEATRAAGDQKTRSVKRLICWTQLVTANWRDGWNARPVYPAEITPSQMTR